jgi:hypothetical protein
LAQVFAESATLNLTIHEPITTDWLEPTIAAVDHDAAPEDDEVASPRGWPDAAVQRAAAHE